MRVICVPLCRGLKNRPASEETCGNTGSTKPIVGPPDHSRSHSRRSTQREVWHIIKRFSALKVRKCSQVDKARRLRLCPSVGALSQPSHAAAVQIIDASFDLDLTGLNLAPQSRAVLHEVIDGVEDVDLHSMHCDLLLFRGAAQLLLRLLGHSVQSLEECTEGVGGLVPGLALVGHVVLRCAVNRTALGVPQHENELGPKSASAKLQ
mmetsp:Transcript_42291/g.88354  ORF Transcript_42291/g.88354 Transcript_42291/m.88354 type:complete len:207 (+) Transcript_42291:52-672(+)